MYITHVYVCVCMYVSTYMYLHVYSCYTYVYIYIEYTRTGGYQGLSEKRPSWPKLGLGELLEGGLRSPRGGGGAWGFLRACVLKEGLEL